MNQLVSQRDSAIAEFEADAPVQYGWRYPRSILPDGRPVHKLARITGLVAAALCCMAAAEDEPLFLQKLNVDPPHISTDKSIRYDYDIVYVRGPRAGDKIHKRFYTDIAQPTYLEPSVDLMLLHPNGSEELLVAGGEGAITDPFVSFDGQWVYYTHIYSLNGFHAYQPARSGADIFKLHLPTRRIVRLTNQRFTPNTGAADWSSDFRKPQSGKTHLDYGVMNMGACPLPGGRVVFTANRNAFRPPRAYPVVALQLFAALVRNGKAVFVGPVVSLIGSTTKV
jgi:hypothetical protein